MSYRKPTIAEERIARIIATFHGGHIIGRQDGETMTIAKMRGDSPWAERSAYVERHWHEYVVAAGAAMDAIQGKDERGHGRG